MQFRRHPLTTVLSALLILLFSTLTVLGQEKGFKGIVQHLEKNYHGKRTRIPMLGLANFVVKIVRPAGVKSFKLAVFEDSDFIVNRGSTSFDSSMRSLMPKEWQPLIRINSKRGGTERTYIYAKPAGKDLQLMTVILEPREAVVMEVRLNPDAVARFLDNPKVMGVSIASGIRGSSSGGPFMGTLAGNRDGNPGIGRRIDERDEGGYTLTAGTPAAAEKSAKVRPALQSASSEEGADSAVKPEAVEPAEPTPVAPSRDAIRIDTQLVNLNIKALDRAGKSSIALSREDFVVYEDGVKQEVSHFDGVSAPINLVLLLDLSGSTNDRREVMLNAAKKFVDSLSPHDRVAVTAFTREYYVVSDFTTDRQQIKNQLGKLKNVSGGTSFYDAIWTTLDLLSKLNDSRKAVVVLTDGVDEQLLGSERGSRRSFELVMDRVVEEDVTIYPIYIDASLPEIQKRLQEPNLNERSRDRIRERSLRPRETARKQLDKLAEETAGIVFTADTESDLEGVYDRVAAELRMLYSLAYSPENNNKDGRFRKVNVEIKRDGVIARTRRGYIAK